MSTEYSLLVECEMALKEAAEKYGEDVVNDVLDRDSYEVSVEDGRVINLSEDDALMMSKNLPKLGRAMQSGYEESVYERAIASFKTFRAVIASGGYVRE